MTSWSLTALCSHCGQFGTVDDITLVCVRCGETHELTDEQRAERDADIDLQQAAPRSPHLAHHRSSVDVGVTRMTHLEDIVGGDEMPDDEDFYADDFD